MSEKNYICNYILENNIKGKCPYNSTCVHCFPHKRKTHCNILCIDNPNSKCVEIKVKKKEEVMERKKFDFTKIISEDLLKDKEIQEIMVKKAKEGLLNYLENYDFTDLYKNFIDTTIDAFLTNYRRELNDIEFFDGIDLDEKIKEPLMKKMEEFLTNIFSYNSIIPISENKRKIKL